MSIKDRLEEKWMWDPGVTRFWQLVIVIIAVVVTVAGVFSLGAGGLYFLLLLLVAWMIGKTTGKGPVLTES